MSNVHTTRSPGKPASSLTLLSAAMFMATQALADPLFTDVSVDAGLANESYFGQTNHALGLIWIDFNEDGWNDIFAVNGFDFSPHLYQNNGDGTFTLVDDLLPALPNVEMGGTVYADYDNDGDSDIYIFVHNEQWDLMGFNEPDGPPNILLKNLYVENGNTVIPGTPLFEDVTAVAGVGGELAVPLGTDYPAQSTMTGGWLDYNRDSCIDLFVGNLVLQRPNEEANRNLLYKNNCDGTFTDVTIESGIDNINYYDPTLAFLGADLSQDGWPDMYVVNVHEQSPDHFDVYFRNNGDGTFTDATGESPGIGDDSGSGMGIDIADINNDGNWDIYMTDFDLTTNDALPLGNPLYIGNSDGTWQDNSADIAGVVGGFSWGTNFLDVDKDGYEDLYVAISGRGTLYMNNQNNTFTDVTQAAGIDATGSGRGSATADYDHDGDVDIAYVDQGGTLHLLRNDSTLAGNSLVVTLTGTESNADAIGAVIKITANGMTQMRTIKGGSSAHSQDALTQYFGVGAATIIDSMTIEWPSGQKQTFANQQVNSIRNVTEPQLPPLSISSVTPATVTQGTSTVFSISGDGFKPGITARLLRAQSTRMNDFRFIDSKTLEMTVTALDTAPLGTRSVVLTNPDGVRFRARDLFEVVTP